MLCAMRDAVGKMNAHPVDKDAMARRLQPMRNIFGRSLAPIRPFPAGTVLAPDMVAPKKPGGGIAPEAVMEIAGRRLVRDVTPERILRWDDFEDSKA